MSVLVIVDDGSTNNMCHRFTNHYSTLTYTYMYMSSASFSSTYGDSKYKWSMQVYVSR